MEMFGTTLVEHTICVLMEQAGVLWRLSVSADSNLLLIAILLFAAANIIIMYNECSYRQYACQVCVCGE